MLSRVAVVDDDAGFRRIAILVLGMRGFEVVCSSSDVESGLRDIAGAAPDGALIDVELPDGSGLELARALRRLPHPPRVVLTSASGIEFSATQLDEAGVRGYVPKEKLPQAPLLELFELD